MFHNGSAWKPPLAAPCVLQQRQLDAGGDLPPLCAAGRHGSWAGSHDDQAMPTSNPPTPTASSQLPAATDPAARGGGAAANCAKPAMSTGPPADVVGAAAAVKQLPPAPAERGAGPTAATPPAAPAWPHLPTFIAPDPAVLKALLKGAELVALAIPPRPPSLRRRKARGPPAQAARSASEPPGQDGHSLSAPGQAAASPATGSPGGSSDWDSEFGSSEDDMSDSDGESECADSDGTISPANGHPLPQQDLAEQQPGTAQQGTWPSEQEVAQAELSLGLFLKMYRAGVARLASHDRELTLCPPGCAALPVPDLHLPLGLSHSWPRASGAAGAHLLHGSWPRPAAVGAPLQQHPEQPEERRQQHLAALAARQEGAGQDARLDPPPSARLGQPATLPAWLQQCAEQQLLGETQLASHPSGQPRHHHSSDAHAQQPAALLAQLPPLGLALDPSGELPAGLGQHASVLRSASPPTPPAAASQASNPARGDSPAAEAAGQGARGTASTAAQHAGAAANARPGHEAQPGDGAAPPPKRARTAADAKPAAGAALGGIDWAAAQDLWALPLEMPDPPSDSEGQAPGPRARPLAVQQQQQTFPPRHLEHPLSPMASLAGSNSSAPRQAQLSNRLRDPTTAPARAAAGPRPRAKRAKREQKAPAAPAPTAAQPSAAVQHTGSGPAACGATGQVVRTLLEEKNIQVVFVGVAGPGGLVLQQLVGGLTCSVELVSLPGASSAAAAQQRQAPAGAAAAGLLTVRVCVRHPSGLVVAQRDGVQPKEAVLVSKLVHGCAAWDSGEGWQLLFNLTPQPGRFFQALKNAASQC